MAQEGYKAGSLVFAKLRGFPYWPARVESKVEGSYYVYFFGTHETTALNISNLIPFNEENKKKYGRVKRKFFAEAMATIQSNPGYKSDCIFNIPGTTVKKSTPTKPVTQVRRKTPNEQISSIPSTPPKAPREPPKSRGPPENENIGTNKRETDLKTSPAQVPILKLKTTEMPKVDAPSTNSAPKAKEPVIVELKSPAKPTEPAPVVYEYLNSEKSPAEMGRLPLMKRKEIPGETSSPREPPTAPVEQEKRSDPEPFSSPIKKRKLSPPKKAPERYMEAASQRRNSAHKREVASDSRSDETASVASDVTTVSSRTVEPARITKRSSGSSRGVGKRGSATIEYEAKQMVFAKVRGHPFWPARVDAVLPGTKPPKYQIFFYGTHENGVLQAKDMLPVNAETKEKHGKPNKRSKFTEGLVEMQVNPWVKFPGGSSVTSTPVPVTSPPSPPVPAIPPVTLVPQLNVQQTSPHSPLGSSQKSVSDKDDSDSASDSSDSVCVQTRDPNERLWQLYGKLPTPN